MGIVKSKLSALKNKKSPPTTTTKMATDAKPVAFSLYKNIPKEFKPALLANENAFLEDIYTSEATNPDKPVSSGLFRLEKGTPLTYTYTYDEMKIILEGHFNISDETGQSHRAVPGDHFFFPKGATITFTTDDYGLAFYVGQRKKGAA